MALLVLMLLRTLLVFSLDHALRGLEARYVPPPQLPGGLLAVLPNSTFLLLFAVVNSDPNRASCNCQSMLVAGVSAGLTVRESNLALLLERLVVVGRVAFRVDVATMNLLGRLQL